MTEIWGDGGRGSDTQKNSKYLGMLAKGILLNLRENGLKAYFIF